MNYYVVVGELDGFKYGQVITKFQLARGENAIRQLVKEGTVVLREDYEAPKPEAPKPKPEVPKSEATQPLPDFLPSGGDTTLSLEDDTDKKGLV